MEGSPWQYIAPWVSIHIQKGQKTAGASLHPQRPSIVFHLISSNLKQQLANQSHHGRNHIQHLRPWFTIPLHTFHSTNVFYMTHNPNPLSCHTSLSHSLHEFEANLSTINCALQCNVKVKHCHYQQLSNISPSFQQHWNTVTVHTAIERLMGHGMPKNKL